MTLITFYLMWIESQSIRTNTRKLVICYSRAKRACDAQIWNQEVSYLTLTNIIHSYKVDRAGKTSNWNDIENIISLANACSLTTIHWWSNWTLLTDSCCVPITRIAFTNWLIISWWWIRRALLTSWNCSSCNNDRVWIAKTFIVWVIGIRRTHHTSKSCRIKNIVRIITNTRCCIWCRERELWTSLYRVTNIHITGNSASGKLFGRINQTRLHLRRTLITLIFWWYPIFVRICAVTCDPCN